MNPFPRAFHHRLTNVNPIPLPVSLLPTVVYLHKRFKNVVQSVLGYPFRCPLLRKTNRSLIQHSNTNGTSLSVNLTEFDKKIKHNAFDFIRVAGDNLFLNIATKIRKWDLLIYIQNRQSNLLCYFTMS